MKFFKCAVYIIFLLTLANLAFSAYMFRELRKPNIIVAPDPALREIKEHSMMRDTQLLQGILMIHHQVGVHTPGKQPMCPICEQMQDKTKTIKNPMIVQEN